MYQLLGDGGVGGRTGFSQTHKSLNHRMGDIFSRRIPLFPSLFICFLCHGVMNFLWSASSQEICPIAATGVHAVHLILLGPGKDFGLLIVYVHVQYPQMNVPCLKNM